MRPLLDNAEKHELATGEELLGRGETRRYCRRREYHSARFDPLDLDDEVLIAPHRDKKARRVGDSFKDPTGVAAAQTGAFEAGMGVEIGRSHSGETGISTVAVATFGLTGYSGCGSPAADRSLANSVRSGRKQP